MLRSILNSARGRSAVPATSAGTLTPLAYRELDAVRRDDPPAVQAFDIPLVSREPLPPVTASSATVRAQRCCVYCGHAIYAPPRVPRLRCPKCFEEIAVQDILLTGDITQPQIITAGKITVAEDARVAADLVASTIDIAGRVLGNALASHTCTIHDTGKIAGRILCRRLHLDPGAEVQGEIELIKN